MSTMTFGWRSSNVTFNNVTRAMKNHDGSYHIYMSNGDYSEVRLGWLWLKVHEEDKTENEEEAGL